MKYILGIIFALFLVGCGDDYEPPEKPEGWTLGSEKPVVVDPTACPQGQSMSANKCVDGKVVPPE